METELYDAHTEHDESHWWFCGRRAVVQSVMRAFFSTTQRYRFLDVGSGPGGMIPLLEQWGSVNACEPNPVMADRLVARFNGRVSVSASSLAELALRNERYDCVTLFDVLEHIEDDAHALQTIARLLNDRGHFLCTVPAFHFLWSGHDDAAHHKRRYTRRELIAKIAAAGFAIDYCSYFNTFLFIPIALVRVYNKIMQKKGHDFATGPYFLNNILKHIFASERYLLPCVRFPVGVSLVVIAHKL